MKLIKIFSIVAAAAMVLVGCNKTTITSTSEITLTANSVVEVNTPITFVVTNAEGEDVSSDATIYDKSHDFAQVSNPFTPTEDDDYTFYAVVGDFISNDLKITVTPKVPTLPEDSDVANTSFVHHILLVDHTGNHCGYCPNMMKALKEVAETGDYHSKYYEAMAHSYTTSDPAFSKAAATVSSHYGVTSYPTVTYNFYYPTSSPQNAAHIKSQIDALWKAEGADVGIAASTILATTCVVVNTEVKAAKENEYSITAWLLEDGVYAKQTNGKEEWMNYHDNTIRQRVNTENIAGVNLGTIAAGETKSEPLTLKIETDKWNRENLKVLIIVSAKNSKGQFEVANVAVCPTDSSISYNYKE